MSNVQVRCLILLALTLTCPGSGEERRTSRRQVSPLIDRTRPSVYLTYIKSEPVTLRSRAVEVIWLELRNNTRWAISHAASPDPLGGTGWCYRVVTDDTCHTRLSRPMGNCSDLIGPVGLGPGRSLLIAVSPEHLSSGFAIETGFRFEWELPDERVEHSLSFGYSDLPTDTQKTFASMEAIARPCCDCAPDSIMPKPRAVTPPALDPPPNLPALDPPPKLLP